MADLKILPPHQHDVANVEKVNPIHFAISFVVSGTFGHSQLVPLGLPVHVALFLKSVNLLDALKGHFECPDGVHR